MPIWRMQCSFGRDSAFIRDRMVITPHFNDQGVGSDPDGLCEDLATALVGWMVNPGEVQVKAYDAQGSQPVLPAGEHTINVGQTPDSNQPRELAVCLSYFSGQNTPTKRGRLYIPATLTISGPTVRVSGTLMQKVADLVPIFTGLGGTDVDWCLYSRKNDTAHPVTNWWVDNEYDTVRSRGLRATARITGTASE